jgi:hypothetical protein
MGMIESLKHLQSHGLPRYENLGMDLIVGFYEFFQNRIIRTIE